MFIAIMYISGAGFPTTCGLTLLAASNHLKYTNSRERALAGGESNIAFVAMNAAASYQSSLGIIFII
jgi:hypothetical protein